MSHGLVHIGALLADPTRTEILVALLDGRARTGSELARHVGVATSTVSEHLGKLLDASLVAVEPQGRHRYWRLAGPSVAHLLESLGANVVGTMPVSPRAPAALLQARSCYDHLAGSLAVAIFDRLVEDHHLVLVDQGVRVTAAGIERLASLGADLTAASRRRPLARACLDWTERRHHLGGAAGRALFDTLLARGWIRRGSRPRLIDVSVEGQRSLRREFGWAPSGRIAEAYERPPVPGDVTGVGR